MIRLNLGCGGRVLDGWVNADREPRSHADLIMDMEVFPWLFGDGEVTEVEASHVLEHIRDLTGVMKELYRVMAPGALLRIAVPHPFSDGFIGDPTHVTPITRATLELFSRRKNIEWRERGWPNTPLALYLDVDFEIDSFEYSLTPHWRDKKLTSANLDYCVASYLNVVDEMRFVMRRV